MLVEKKEFCEQMTYGKDININWNTCIGSNGNYIFRNMTENRKRSREDDACEFMPLSKRINNLHINNNLANTPVSQNQDHTRINGISTENGIASPHSSTTDCERRPSYDPGVSSSESSYYYENKLLFELHLERIQRSGQQFPF
ncbi:uncharacterized protein LOC113512701 isoform X2 [Galleria mellonella]|uniref:Uncharacterized protein LOC113512701 isoform X2 n=1 Tax=Galleria mellonella TaxID=7137 RepID=A0A6J1WLY0_GALME|nr:uncharacterized protein LOC113512701 isoform X2 [Galleria mellonella]